MLIYNPSSLFLQVMVSIIFMFPTFQITYFSTTLELVLVQFLTINPLNTYFIPIAPWFISTLSSYSFENFLILFTMDLNSSLNLSLGYTSFKFLCIFKIKSIYKCIIFLNCATCCYFSIVLYRRHSTFLLLGIISLSCNFIAYTFFNSPSMFTLALTSI